MKSRLARLAAAAFVLAAVYLAGRWSVPALRSSSTGESGRTSTTLFYPTDPSGSAPAAEARHAGKRDAVAVAKPTSNGAARTLPPYVPRVDRSGTLEVTLPAGTAAPQGTLVDAAGLALPTPSNFGTILGYAKLAGAPPAPEHIEATGECPDGLVDESILVDENGLLSNVVVRIVDLPMKPIEASARPVIAERVLLRGCSFVPRVSAVRVDEAVSIGNDDPFPHSLNAYVGERSLTRFPLVSSQKLNLAAGHMKEGPLTLRCDLHPWEIAHVFVSPTPYFGVAENGGSALLSVPAGTYTVEAWHERLGIRRTEVTVVEGGVTPVEFRFELPSPAPILSNLHVEAP